MRLFVAVWPPPPAVEVLAALPRPEVPGLRWTSPAHWHVTLRFLGEAEVADAQVAVRLLEADGGAGTVAELGPSTGRFGHRVLHAPVSGLEGLAAATVAATAGVGEPPDPRPFAGHITLARARGRGGVDLSCLTGTAVSASWMVDELTLVASRSGREGARYEVVERIALAGPDQGPCPNARSQLQ